MSDDDPREIQARHLEENRKQANATASRAIVRREIEGAFREAGINLSEWKDVQEFRRDVAFVRELRETDGFWETYTFSAELRRKTKELGTENRKGMVAALYALIAAIVSGAGAAWIALKSGGGHP